MRIGQNLLPPSQELCVVRTMLEPHTSGESEGDEIPKRDGSIQRSALPRIAERNKTMFISKGRKHFQEIAISKRLKVITDITEDVKFRWKLNFHADAARRRAHCASIADISDCNVEISCLICQAFFSRWWGEIDSRKKQLYLLYHSIDWIFFPLTESNYNFNVRARNRPVKFVRYFFEVLARNEKQNTRESKHVAAFKLKRAKIRFRVTRNVTSNFIYSPCQYLSIYWQVISRRFVFFALEPTLLQVVSSVSCFSAVVHEIERRFENLHARVYVWKPD